MKQYRLIVAPIVHQQIREQVIYIDQDSIDPALAWEDRLQNATEGLPRSLAMRPMKTPPIA